MFLFTKAEPNKSSLKESFGRLNTFPVTTSYLIVNEPPLKTDITIFYVQYECPLPTLYYTQYKRRPNMTTKKICTENAREYD